MSVMRRFYLDELRRAHTQLNESAREDVFLAVGAAEIAIENALLEFGSVDDQRYVELCRENYHLRNALSKKVSA